MGRVLTAAALAGGMLLAPVHAAAPPAPEFQAKVQIMDRLTRFVDWPPRPAPGHGAFVLVVLGRTPFGDVLDTYFAAHPLQDRPVSVRYLGRAADLPECDLLFICASEKPRLPEILARVRGRPVLTVADTEGFAQAGVMVGLVNRNGRIAFELNLAPARESGFRMAPGLLQLAQLVP